MFTSSSTTSTRRGEPSARVRSAAATLTGSTSWDQPATLVCAFPVRNLLGAPVPSEAIHRSSTAIRGTILVMSDPQPTPAQPEPAANRPAEPVAATPPPPPPPGPPAAPVAQRTRLRDLAFGLRSLLAVAVAGVIVGGLAGFGIHAATDDDHRDGRMGGFGPGFGPGRGFGDGAGHHGFPGGGTPGGPGQTGGAAPPRVAGPRAGARPPTPPPPPPVRTSRPRRRPRLRASPSVQLSGCQSQPDWASLRQRGRTVRHELTTGLGRALLGGTRDDDFTAYVVGRRAHLFRAAYLLCGDPHRAEDVVQTALAKLYVAWPRASRADSVDAYVRRIIINSHLDERRRPWRRESPTTDDRLDRPAPVGVTPEDSDALWSALRRLGPKQRRVVVLRHYWGLSV